MSRENVELVRRILDPYSRRDMVVPNVAYQRGRDGIEISAPSTLMYTLRGCKVTRVCLYQDEAEALKAVGLAE
jgi:hypothetical protein